MATTERSGAPSHVMRQDDPLAAASRVCFIVNPASGGVPGDAAGALSASWAQLGLSPHLDVRDIGEDDVEAGIAAAIASGPDVLGVWGGDGTMACALAQAAAAGLPALVLPGGTMNLLPRRLFDGETDWRACLQRLSQSARMKSLPAGEVDGKRFFVAAMFGDLAGLSDAREALRGGAFGEAADLILSGGAFSLSPNLSLDFLLRDGSHSQRRATAASIVVGADGGDNLLELALLEAENLIELGTAGLETLLRGWREAESLERIEAKAIAVDYDGEGELPCTLDGEKVHMSGTSRFTLIPAVADVLVPAA